MHDGSLLASLEAGSRGLASIAIAPAAFPRSGPRPALPFVRAKIVAGSKDASIRQFQLVEMSAYDDSETIDSSAGRGPLTFREMMDHDTPSASSVGPMADSTSASASSARRDSEGCGDTKLVIEPLGRCVAPCSCPAGLSKPSSHFCQRCYNFGHTDLVRTVAIRQGLILSGSYDSTVKVSRPSPRDSMLMRSRYGTLNRAGCYGISRATKALGSCAWSVIARE